LVIINSKISSIYLILTYECKDFSNQKWGKQKNPAGAELFA